MRILCVIENLSAGGAQRQLVNLARGLKRNGHAVELFTYYPQDFFKPELDQSGIPTHLCLKRKRFSLVPVWELSQLIRRGAFDVVLAFLKTSVIYTELACIGMPDVRVIVSERSGVINGYLSAGRLVTSWLHLLAHSVVVNSNAHRDWMAARFPFLTSRLVTIWNGVDTEVFHPVESNSMRGMLKLLGVGRINPAKNLLALVHALAQCRSKNLQVTLDWAGEPDDQACHLEVLTAIEDHQLGSIWRWLGVRKDIPALLNQYDALILPSLWEGLPNVVCEALAAGLPVLASDVSDNARLVQDGVTGLIFDPNQPSAIAHAIQTYAGMNMNTRVRFRHEAREFAVKQLSIQSCLSAYERLINAKS